MRRVLVWSFRLAALLGAGTAGFVLGVRHAPAPSPRRPEPATPPPAGHALPLGASPTAGSRRAAEPRGASPADLAAQPPSPARNAAFLLALEELAHTDPTAALALAGAERNRALRAELFAAVLRGWGAADPEPAAAWAFTTREPGDVIARLGCVLDGTAADPGAAADLTLRLAEAHPDEAGDIGRALLQSLARRGAFADAAHFALAANGPLQRDWVAAAFGNWGNFQPGAAAAAALQLRDADARSTALDAVLGSWAANEPKGLASFALTSLPPGDQRTRAVSTALIHWSADDPIAAADWINHHGPAPEFDQGEAAIATNPAVLRQPETALRWASVISDPTLRSRTLVAVVQTWAERNPVAAEQYLRASPDVLPNDRAAAIGHLTRRE